MNILNALIAGSGAENNLNFSWSLWFFKNEKGNQWKDNLRLVTSFSTVEDFWAIYNHIQVRNDRLVRPTIVSLAFLKTANGM